MTQYPMQIYYITMQIACNSMDKEKEQKAYEFTSDYRKLPIKKRANLIIIAKNLLRLQRENNALLTDAVAFQSSHKD